MLNTCSGNNSSLPLESRGATQSAAPSPAIAIQIEVMVMMCDYKEEMVPQKTFWLQEYFKSLRTQLMTSLCSPGGH